MPDDMVEQPSEPCEPQGLSDGGLQQLRHRLPGVWKCAEKVLFTSMFGCIPAKGGGCMNESMLCYRTAMAVALGMLRDGIISEEEYDQIDRIIANKYGLTSGSLFCRNPLILQGFRANMSHTEGGVANGTHD